MYQTVAGKSVTIGNVFGIPPEVYVVFALAAVALVWLVFKYNVKGTPAQVLWLYKNYSGKLFRVMEDLGGIFLYILSANGKKAETLKKTGQPIEVDVIPRTVSYFLDDDGYYNVLSEKLRADIEAAGFKITQRPLESVGRIRRKIQSKGYLVKAETPKSRLAYIDVAASGGPKRIRLYVAVEGTGTTTEFVDVRGIVDGAKNVDPGNSSIIHEERSAVKAFLSEWAAALRGTLQNLILPMATGAGLLAMVLLIVELIRGKL